MADEEEVLPDVQDDIEPGPEGEGAEGEGPGEGDQDSEVSADGADAAPAGDDGIPDGRPQGDTGRHLSRGARRVQEVTNERNALRDRVAQMERQLEAERQRQAAYDQQYNQQQWQERWNVMTDAEKVEELRIQGQQWGQQLQGQFTTQLQIMRDQLAYEAKASVNPVYARHKDEVEQIHNEYAQRGNFVPRQLILENLMGKRAIESASKSTASARKAGQKKIEAQTTRPTSNKGDAASSRGKQGDTAEKRLAGVEI